MKWFIVLDKTLLLTLEGIKPTVTNVDLWVKDNPYLERIL